MTADLSALYREDADEEAVLDAYQVLIDTGSAWQMDGSTGRACMAAIEEGLCILGPTRHVDAYGAHVPGRDEVVPGTKGSLKFARERHPERFPAEEAFRLSEDRIATGEVIS